MYAPSSSDHNNGKRLDDVVSKKNLAKDLIVPKIIEIEEEYARNQWKAKLSIKEDTKNLECFHIDYEAKVVNQY